MPLQYKAHPDKEIQVDLDTMTGVALVEQVVRDRHLQSQVVLQLELGVVVVHRGLVHQRVAAQVAAAQQVHQVEVATVIQQLVQIQDLAVVVEMETRLEAVMAQRDW
jgi:hypothetical protein